MHRLIRNILRFIIRHEKIYKIFNKRKWFTKLCNKEAHRVIDGL